MFKHLLVATDGSSVAAIATRTAMGLAKACGASVTAVHVIEPFRATTYGEMMLPGCETAYLDAARNDAARYLLDVERAAAEAA